MTAETVDRAEGPEANHSPWRTNSSEQPRSGLLGDSVRIAAASALSRLTGLLRVIVAASILGATVLGDLFVAINVLPLTLYDVFAGSAISSVLVPPLVNLLGGTGRDAAKRFAANALGIICATMAVLAGGAIAARSLLAGALTAGVDETLSDDAVAVGSLLLLLILPQLVLYAAIGVFVSIQHANHRFLIPSAAPIVENLGLLITIAVAWRRYGSGLEVDQATTGLILTLAIGSGLSVTAHTLVQFLGARSAMGSVGIGADVRDPAIRRLVKPARASFGWSSIIAIRQFALVVAAGFAGAGGVQAFEVATLAYFIPVALIGRPIASAALPRLAAARDTGSLLRGYLGALRIAAWVAVPAGAALVVLAQPLASTLALGKFAEGNAVTMLTYGLAGLGLGAAADALFEVGRQATMALQPSSSNQQGQSAVGLVRSTWLRAAVAAVGIPAVVMTIDGPIVLLALGLVVSIGDLVAFALVHRDLRNNPQWTTSDGATHWPRIVVATAVATAVPVLAATAFGVTWGPITTAALGVVVLFTYLIMAYLFTGRGHLLRQLTGELQTEEAR